MKAPLALAIATFIAGCGVQQAAPDPPAKQSPTAKAITSKPIHVTASDGKRVYADFYLKGNSKSVILLFHQARSNAKEYATIAPKLVDQGFDCLAVDLRCGGTMWGVDNRTGNMNGPYISAYADMQAALKWAKAKYKSIAVVGSSYSACLALKMGAENPDIKCIAAFSPGEYFPNKRQVKDWNSHCRVPVLMAMTPSEQENGGLTLYQAGAGNVERARGDMILCFPNSVHGASSLREDKNPSGYRTYQQGFFAFLKRHAK